MPDTAVGLGLAALAALGVHQILKAQLLKIQRQGALKQHGGAHPVAPKRPNIVARSWNSLTDWMQRSGLEAVTPTQFLAASAGMGLIGLLATTAVLGPGVPSAAAAVAVACVPTGYWRRRHIAAREATRDCWPRLIEELRVLVGSAGRSIPQALIEVGTRGPKELQPAFAAAQREWALTTDFASMIAVLKERLGDPCADATCETLLTAYEVGGPVDSRLAELADDRRADLRERREADARQSGARLARWFVIIVPAGMAFAGWNLGEGSDSFSSAAGQIAGSAAVALIAICWWWAGRIMVLPTEKRVFDK